MTAPNHMIQSGFIQYYINSNPYAIGMAMILGGLWDYFHMQDEEGNWAIYNIAHKYVWWKWFIPYANLHLLEDWVTHKKEGGINKLYVPLEIVLWVTMAVLFYYRFI